MEFKMVGIDHSIASLDVREKFAFTTSEAIEAMKEINTIDGVNGCLILSTCNRTELWISGDKGCINPDEVLCNIKNVEKNQSQKYFVCRKGKAAVEHLLVTSCGINSKVFGEDQIVTQIKEALQLTRKNKTSDKYIEKIFQNSISAAKKVKTTVSLTTYNPSVANSGISKLIDAYGDIKGKRCLIIGNGKMGVLIAEHLVRAKADVFMTLRKKYHNADNRESLIPEGCTMVPYEKRIENLKDAEIVISATLSPHYTISLEDIKEASIIEPAIWLDLAVPRDIDPKISENREIKILDIDSLDTGIYDENKELNIEKAKNVLESYGQEIEKWVKFRKRMPTVTKILDLAANDTWLRTKSELSQEDIQENMEEVVVEASKKGINKLLCGLKDTLPEEYWDICFNAILESAKKDTIKK
ncbi:MAG: glutamyl-tRNA reductase [Anaerovoracaceae bacterium]